MSHNIFGCFCSSSFFGGWEGGGEGGAVPLSFLLFPLYKLCIPESSAPMPSPACIPLHNNKNKHKHVYESIVTCQMVELAPTHIRVHTCIDTHACTHTCMHVRKRTHTHTSFCLRASPAWSFNIQLTVTKCALLCKQIVSQLQCRWLLLQIGRLGGKKEEKKKNSASHLSLTWRQTWPVLDE